MSRGHLVTVPTRTHVKSLSPLFQSVKPKRIFFFFKWIQRTMKPMNCNFNNQSNHHKSFMFKWNFPFLIWQIWQLFSFCCTILHSNNSTPNTNCLVLYDAHLQHILSQQQTRAVRMTPVEKATRTSGLCKNSKTFSRSGGDVISRLTGKGSVIADRKTCWTNTALRKFMFSPSHTQVQSEPLQVVLLQSMVINMVNGDCSFLMTLHIRPSKSNWLEGVSANTQGLKNNNKMKISTVGSVLFVQQHH